MSETLFNNNCPFLFINRDSYFEESPTFEVRIPGAEREIALIPNLSFDKENDDVYVLDIGVQTTIFQLTPAQMEQLREVVLSYKEVIDAYLQICVYDPVGPIPHSVLVRLAECNLTEDEQKAVQAEIANFTFIYFIRDRRTGYVKIGKSNDPESRLRQLKRQDTLLPLENDFFIEFFFRNYAYVEKRLHQHLADKRVRGEWFSLSDEDMAKLREEFLDLNIHHG